MTTILQDVLASAARRLADAGIDTPLLDAQSIMASVLGCSRLDLIAHPNRELTEPQSEEFLSMLNRREARFPLAYLIGKREFHGLEIDVTPDVLVPRPETETLIDVCVVSLWGGRTTVVDVGTGSGAIAIALARNLPDARVYAIDNSAAALKVARANVEKHQLSDRVTVLQGDLLRPLRNAGVAFDAIVGNPPYVPTAEIENLQPEIRLYEPRSALDGGADGLDVYRRLLPDALPLLDEGGFVAVEVGLGQADAVRSIAVGCGYHTIETARDLAGIERVVVVCK